MNEAIFFSSFALSSEKSSMAARRSRMVDITGVLSVPDFNVDDALERFAVSIVIAVGPKQIHHRV